MYMYMCVCVYICMYVYMYLCIYIYKSDDLQQPVECVEQLQHEFVVVLPLSDERVESAHLRPANKT